MVTVQLTGGLGNQLFQYAAAKALSLHHSVPLQLDIGWFFKKELHYLEVPREFELYSFKGIDEKVVRLHHKPTTPISTIVKRLPLQNLFPNYKKTVYEEPFFHFDTNFFESKKEVTLKGQWQSYKYFERYSTELKKALVLKDNLLEKSLELADRFASINSVAVHVRRADYLRLKIILEWHGVMEEGYYRNAFLHLDNKIGGYEVFYFTDDPAWVKEKLIPIREGQILSDQSMRTHYEDFHLMSHCRHNIIANSSFSWWAAWLNSNPEKVVIAPKQWFQNGPKDTYDLLPSDWVQI